MTQVYLNNAATSFPKPDRVVAAVAESMTTLPVEPGRTVGNADPAVACRERLAGLFGLHDPNLIALLPSATYALNAVLLGLLEPGDHVVTSVVEHNSMLRPLAHLRRERDVRVTFVEPEEDGCLRPQELAAAFQPNTKLVALSHVSNVLGTVQPVAEVAELAAAKGVAFLIDAAQSAGALDLDLGNLPGRVFVACAGHKGLMGCAGIGVLALPDGSLQQTVFGGTGIRSESELHPEELPLRHEAGTPCLPGVAALTAAVRFVEERGVEALGKARSRLVRSAREALAELVGLRLFPGQLADERGGIVAFTVAQQTAKELAFALKQSFGIDTRAGLHCAPLLHRWLGTSPDGVVRVSFGPFNAESDVSYLTESVRQLCEP